MDHPLTSTITVPLRGRRVRVISAVVLFAGAATFAVLALPGGATAALLGGGAVIMTAVGVIALVNVLTHEGWAVVLAADALELPRAPLLSRRRERIPYARIGFVGLSDPGTDPMVIIELGPDDATRWVRQADLATGAVDELARLLTARVTAVRGEGALVRRSR